MTNPPPGQAVTIERAVEVVGCPSCHQPAGAQCRTPGGRLAPCHAPRYELAKANLTERAKLEAWNRSVREGG